MNDVVEIGGGPVGPCAAYYAGCPCRSTAIVDSPPEAGGPLGVDTDCAAGCEVA